MDHLLPNTYYQSKITLALPNLFPLSETINGSTRASYDMNNTLGDTLKTDNYNQSYELGYSRSVLGVLDSGRLQSD